LEADIFKGVSATMLLQSSSCVMHIKHRREM
jgi:hypothetical protein